MLIALVLAIWTAVSLPVALLVGAAIRLANRKEQQQ